MNIYSQNIYEVIENGVKKHIVIIFNISENHYVGVTVHVNNYDNLIHLASINRFVDIKSLQEYSKKFIVGLVYIKGKFLKLNNTDFSHLLKLLKSSLIQNLYKKIDYKNIDQMKYLKWCYDKLILNGSNFNIPILKPGSICWVDFGQNIGSELRKLRPAILWRSSADKRMWTVIPLSSKCYNDRYYFHCDIEGLSCSTAKLESMSNFSYKRIREPFFSNKKIAHISQNDYLNILTSLKKYYTFEN